MFSVNTPHASCRHQLEGKINTVQSGVKCALCYRSYLIHFCPVGEGGCTMVCQLTDYRFVYYTTVGMHYRHHIKQLVAPSYHQK